MPNRNVIHVDGQQEVALHSRVAAVRPASTLCPVQTSLLHLQPDGLSVGLAVLANFAWRPLLTTLIAKA